MTLGSGLYRQCDGRWAQIAAGSYSGDGIVNDGAIDDAGRSGFLEIRRETPSPTGNDRRHVKRRSSIEHRHFTNRTIDVANDQTLDVHSTFFANSSGTITVDGTSGIELDETLTTAQLGTVNAASGATIDFAGGLYNTGATFRAAPGCGRGLDLRRHDQRPDQSDGARPRPSLLGGIPVVTGAAGTGPGTINVTANSTPQF